MIAGHQATRTNVPFGTGGQASGVRLKVQGVWLKAIINGCNCRNGRRIAIVAMVIKGSRQQPMDEVGAMIFAVNPAPYAL